MSKEKKELNILDQVKQTEKLNLLMENMEQLKANMLKIAELKKQNEVIFEKVGLDDKEIKQIIDYIKSIKAEDVANNGYVFNFVDDFNPSTANRYVHPNHNYCYLL